MNRADRWASGAAFAVGFIGVVYLVVLGVGLARFGGSQPISGPVLVAMEILTMASALAIMFCFAWIASRAAEDHRLFGTIAFACAVAFFATTSAVHFVQLTAGRQLGSADMVWPSVAYAAELLAWDGFLGVALIFAAWTFRPRGLERWVRGGFLSSGVLALAGLVGPLSGRMALQRVGIVGYAIVLPAAFLVLGVLLRREAAMSPARLAEDRPR